MLRDLAAIVTLVGVGWLIYRMERHMADFTALKTSVANLGTELTDATGRIEADVQALKDRISQLELDTADQAEIDALTAQLDESVARVKSIDPVAAVPTDDVRAEPGTDPTV